MVRAAEWECRARLWTIHHHAITRMLIFLSEASIDRLANIELSILILLFGHFSL